MYDQKRSRTYEHMYYEQKRATRVKKHKIKNRQSEQKHWSLVRDDRNHYNFDSADGFISLNSFSAENRYVELWVLFVPSLYRLYSMAFTMTLLFHV